MPKKDQQGYYGFDPSGLERAATAAKYLDQSPNAKSAFDLAIKKEDTKQMELQENTKKLEVNKVQIENEEKRKTIQYEQEMAKRRAEYQVQLELQRDQEKIKQKESMREMRRQRDEDSVNKQEHLKRQTIEYENQCQMQRMQYEYQMKAQLKQQQMEEQQRIDTDKQNKQEEFMQNLMKESEDSRKKSQKENLITGINAMGQATQNMFTNPKMLAKASYLIVLTLGAYQISKLVFSFLLTSLVGRYGKPQLVRETSKIATSNYFVLPYMYTKKFIQQNMKRTEKDLLDGVILEKGLEDQLREISYAILNRKKHFAPCKNLMFYGPPGTGKTLFAKKLAMKSGLEYAVMVGSDIAPLGPIAVKEINNLFDWSEQQKNGIIVFIDEADAFLRNRRSEDMSEYMRHTINSFLYRTGTPSDNVIVVLATNVPEQLDEAVHDRIDEIVQFGLPSINERRTILFHYLVLYCQPPVTLYEQLKFAQKHPRRIFTGKKLIRMEGVSKEVVQDIAEQTEGFSGRELMKMVVAWHDAAFTLPDATLTPHLMKKILDKFHLQHKLKDTWSKDESNIFEKLIFLDEGAKGSIEVKEKDDKMVQEQNRLTKEIEQSRLDIKEMRDT